MYKAVIQLAIPGPRQPMARDLAAGGLQWGGAGVSGEVVLGREPANVADLAEEPAAASWPLTSSPTSANWSSGITAVEARIKAAVAQSNTSLLELSGVGPVLAGDCRLAGGRDRGQQRGGPVGSEVASGAAWDQVHEQPVEPVMVWVRAATRSWRRLVKRCST